MATEQTSSAVASEHTSFLQGYNSLPDELKLKIFGYVLRQEELVDRKTPLGLLDGRAQSLLSPKFKDAEIAKEAFYASNTFLIEALNPGCFLPPARYRSFIRNLHVYIFPLKSAWTMLSTFRTKTLFQEVRHLAISVDLDLTLSSNMYRHCARGRGIACKIRTRSWILKSDLAPVAFDMRKLEIELVPIRFCEDARRE